MHNTCSSPMCSKGRRQRSTEFEVYAHSPLGTCSVWFR